MPEYILNDQRLYPTKEAKEIEVDIPQNLKEFDDSLNVLYSRGFILGEENLALNIEPTWQLKDSITQSQLPETTDSILKLAGINDPRKTDDQVKFEFCFLNSLTSGSGKLAFILSWDMDLSKIYENSKGPIDSLNIVFYCNGGEIVTYSHLLITSFTHGHIVPTRDHDSITGYSYGNDVDTLIGIERSKTLQAITHPRYTQSLQLPLLRELILLGENALNRKKQTTKEK